MSTAAQDLEEAIAYRQIVIRKRPEPGIQERMTFPDASVCERLGVEPMDDPGLFATRWRVTAGENMAQQWLKAEHLRETLGDSQRGIDALVARAGELGVTLDPTAETPRDPVEALADFIDGASPHHGHHPDATAKARKALTALTSRLDRAEIEAIHQRDLVNLANDRAAELSRKLAGSAEPPEGWRWIDGVLVHRDGRVAVIAAFGMACHRRGSDESAMLPLDVARYLLAWRERGEPCPDCDGTGWASESNPGTGQGGRDEQLAVPCPRGCPDAE